MFKKCLNAAFDNPLLTDATTKLEKLPMSSDFSAISFGIVNILEVFSLWGFSYLLFFVVYMVNDFVSSPSLIWFWFEGRFYFSEMIFFKPKSFSFSFPIEFYLALLERSESASFRRVFFLFDVSRAVLKSILHEFFLVRDPGVGFLAVTLSALGFVSGLKKGSLTFSLFVLSFLSLLVNCNPKV